jgi:hypothetical protein
MRSIIILLTLAFTGIAAAQCGMTVSIMAGNTCSGGSVSVNTTGGVGPYYINVERLMAGGSWQLAFIASNDADGDQFWNITPLDVNWVPSVAARVTVTDINNCTATTMSQFWASLNPDPVSFSSVEVDCQTGLSSPVLYLNTSSSQPPPTYSLSSLGSGPFSSNWTLISSGL